MTWLEISSVVVAGGAILAIIIGTQRHNSVCRARIYERLDDYKGDLERKIEKDYSRKEICALTHNQVERELKEIKAQTNLIPGIAAQVKLLVNGKTKT